MVLLKPDLSPRRFVGEGARIDERRALGEGARVEDGSLVDPGDGARSFDDREEIGEGARTPKVRVP